MVLNSLGKLGDIYIYPIKSLAGIKLNEAVVTKYGIAHPNNHQIIDRYYYQSLLIL